MTAADLLLDLVRLGVGLQADGERLRYFPRSVLTPDLLDRLKAHKTELLAMLRRPPEAARAWPPVMGYATPKPTKAVCRCAGTAWCDVPIHGGQSVRRDCADCGRFLDFPVWHGEHLPTITQRRAQNESDSHSTEPS